MFSRRSTIFWKKPKVKHAKQHQTQRAPWKLSLSPLALIVRYRRDCSSQREKEASPLHFCSLITSGRSSWSQRLVRGNKRKFKRRRLTKKDIFSNMSQETQALLALIQGIDGKDWASRRRGWSAQAEEPGKCGGSCPSKLVNFRETDQILMCSFSFSHV